MKHYFCVPSYNVLRQYLYFKQKFQDITIVSGNEDIVKLARYMQWAVIDCCTTPQNPENRAINKFRRLLRFWKRSNENINSTISKIDNGIFYFSTLLIDLWTLKLVQRLALKKDVKIIYLEDVKVVASHKKLKRVNLLYRYRQCYAMLLYLLPLKWFDTTYGHYLGVDQGFLKKNGISRDTSPEPFYSAVESPTIQSTTSFGVLILGGKMIDENKEQWDTEDLKAVYRFIKKIRPDAYFKYHPGTVVHDEISDSFNQVERFIPVEFLRKSIKIAVSDLSHGLIGLSLCGVQCISYLNLIKTCPGFDKDYWVKFIIENSNGRIHFVNSFDELAVLLKN